MEKAEIIQYFLTKGVQVNDKALNLIFLQPELLEKFKSVPDNILPLVITEDFIIRNITKHSVETLKKPNIKSTYTINEIIQIYNHRYRVMREVLLRKNLPDLISINRISNKTQFFSLIAVVNDIENNSITLEDTTGSIICKIAQEQSQQLLIGDVIGVVCAYNGNNVEINEIVYPDIELKKEVTKSKVECKVLIIQGSNHLLKPNIYHKFQDLVEKEKYDFVLILCELGDRDKLKGGFDDKLFNKTILFTTPESNDTNYTLPCLIEINNVRLLLSTDNFLNIYMEKLNLDLEKTIHILFKKRNLNPNVDLDHIYFLDIIPDIIVLSYDGTAEIVNYKGTTILAGNIKEEPIFWYVNLQTREAFKIVMP